jgi:hypothetical protein
VDELNIRLNKNQGEFDYEILANQWEVGHLMNWGFTMKELEIDLPDLTNESSERKKNDQDEESDVECPKCKYRFCP